MLYTTRKALSMPISGVIGYKAPEALSLQEIRAGRLNASGLSDMLGFTPLRLQTTKAELTSYLSADGATPPVPDDRRIATRPPASGRSPPESLSAALMPAH
jgi:hypothetical protein